MKQEVHIAASGETIAVIAPRDAFSAIYRVLQDIDWGNCAGAELVEAIGDELRDEH